MRISPCSDYIADKLQNILLYNYIHVHYSILHHVLHSIVG